MLKQLLREDDGQDMVEYSLLLGFISLAGAATYLTLGSNVSILWGIVDKRLTDASK
jgi:Flp pilus assembly pilin Flp